MRILLILFTNLWADGTSSPGPLREASFTRGAARLRVPRHGGSSSRVGLRRSSHGPQGATTGTVALAVVALARRGCGTQMAGVDLDESWLSAGVATIGWSFGGVVRFTSHLI